jgi:hypothetical protein
VSLKTSLKPGTEGHSWRAFDNGAIGLIRTIAHIWVPQLQHPVFHHRRQKTGLQLIRVSIYQRSKFGCR